MELTPLRTLGLAAALVFAALTVRAYRREKIGNGDVILRLLVFVVPLLAVSVAPSLLGWLFDELSFAKGGGRRVLGATVLAVGLLYAFSYILSARAERTKRDLTRLIENLALEQFRQTGHPEEFAGGLAVVIPAYNEEGNIGHVLGTLPDEVCGLPVHTIVVDDGSLDETTERARILGAAAV